MTGLSQLELDALCCEGSGDETTERPQSPQDSSLKKRRRRVTMFAMKAEIAALTEEFETSDECSKGLTQSQLDELANVSEDAEQFVRSSSPISSSLHKAKRSRLSVSHGVAGAAQRAAEMLGIKPVSSTTRGLSQAELDELSSPVKASTNRRKINVTPLDANSLDIDAAVEGECKSPNKLFAGSPPPSPCRANRRLQQSAASVN
jgi:alanyl-tRNA synthetase